MKALDAPWCVEELAYRRLDGRYLDFFMPAHLDRGERPHRGLELPRP